MTSVDKQEAECEKPAPDLIRLSEPPVPHCTSDKCTSSFNVINSRPLTYLQVVQKILYSMLCFRTYLFFIE